VTYRSQLNLPAENSERWNAQAMSSSKLLPGQRAEAKEGEIQLEVEVITHTEFCSWELCSSCGHQGHERDEHFHIYTEDEETQTRLLAAFACSSKCLIKQMLTESSALRKSHWQISRRIYSTDARGGLWRLVK
jgi:hypothetical protein